MLIFFIVSSITLDRFFPKIFTATLFYFYLGHTIKKMIIELTQQILKAKVVYTLI